MPRKSWRLIKRSRQETARPEPVRYPAWAVVPAKLDGVPFEIALDRLMSVEYARTLFGEDWYAIDLWCDDEKIGLQLIKFAAWEKLVDERYAKLDQALARAKEIMVRLEPFVMEALL